MSHTLRQIGLGLLAGLLAACGQLAPATTPAQLRHTPGPPVVLDAARVNTSAFSVQSPPGWQIVTAPAFAQPWLVFISPEQDAVIMFALDADDMQDVQPQQIAGELVRQTQTITLNDGQRVHALLVAGDGLIEEYADTFETLIESLGLPS